MRVIKEMVDYRKLAYKLSKSTAGERETMLNLGAYRMGAKKWCPKHGNLEHKLRNTKGLKILC